MTSDPLLVVTSVAAERDAILAGLSEPGAVEVCAVEVCVVGVGPAAAAAGTARLLARKSYRAVLNAGIGGGFDGRVALGGVTVGSETIAADLGAGTPNGFLPLDELGFGPVRYPADPVLFASLRAALPDVVTGPVLTVSTTTGSAAATAALRNRYPDAVAEGMEGFGVATAAALSGVPFAELRAISNTVGPRDRDAWRIPQALAALSGAAGWLAKLRW